MGKVTGVVHKHDYPKDLDEVDYKGGLLYPAGTVWQCSCFANFYASTDRWYPYSGLVDKPE